MATQLFIYHVATGRVLATASYDEETDGGPPGERAAALGIVNPETHYAPEGAITPRPLNTANIDRVIVPANDVTPITISNVPNPSVVTIRSVTEIQAPVQATVLDGIAVITFNRPGVYDISLDSFPSQEVKFTIQAAIP
jgi:hypothetical protein